VRGRLQKLGIYRESGHEPPNGVLLVNRPFGSVSPTSTHFESAVW
jgi:hypothetical protein